MEEVVINSGDTAWMLISTGLVVLMIPGLALFYGGMVRVKSVLNMMMMSFGALAVVFVLWIAFGFSMVFGDSVGGRGLIGDIGQFTFLNGLDNSTALIGTIPAAVFIAFQGIFAAITVALISGSIADRAKFGAWMVFAGIWATLVYFPVAHWVFAFDDFVAKTGGWIANDLGALDFAGGTAVSPTDYDFATRKINVVKNVSSFFIRANITDDGDPDGDKTLIFAIRNGQGPCYLGKDTLLTLLIKDNEASVVKRFDAGSIKMYPNPTNGAVKVDCNQAMRSVKVYTMSGQLVREMNLVTGSNRSAEFTMNGTPGLYRVQVVTESGDMYSDFLSFQ